MRLYTVQTQDGRILVSDPINGYHFKPKEDLFHMSVEDPLGEEGNGPLEYILEGEVPIVQVFPKREWAETFMNSDLIHPKEELFIQEVMEMTDPLDAMLRGHS